MGKNYPMSGNPIFNRWYKDRDFPEVKSGNDSIVATIDHANSLQSVIDLHNELLDEYIMLKGQVAAAKDHMSRHTTREQVMLKKISDLNERIIQLEQAMVVGIEGLGWLISRARSYVHLRIDDSLSAKHLMQKILEQK